MAKHGYTFTNKSVGYEFKSDKPEKAAIKIDYRLWAKTGAAFWTAFLFETPFAFFRGFFWVVMPIMIVINLIFAVKANKQYQKNIRG